MGDRITANLPARDLAATRAFYERLGFAVEFADNTWMILSRGAMEIEFFPHPQLAPKESWFSACLRVDDPDALYAEWQGLGLSADEGAIPRLTGFFKTGDDLRMFALVDPDGSLLRVIDNRG